MEPGEVISWRLKNQQLTEHQFVHPGELVSWMGAMQAQDFPMVRWAMGIRIPGISEKDVFDAFDRGDIVRTHLLRPTWHIVHAADLGWMLRLTAPAIRKSILSSEKTVGLSEKDFKRSNKLIEKRLQREGPMTRDEMKSFFKSEGLETQMNMPAHYLMHAELAGIICSGPFREGQPTYALIQDWIRDDQKLSREESIAEFARRYFPSHGPATLKDFSWWSGLPATEILKAINMHHAFDSFIYAEQEYYFVQEGHKKNTANPTCHLLPAYDEYIISYKDRSLLLPAVKHHNAISSNGVFRPVVLHNGKVIGTWQRIKTRTGPQVKTLFFNSRKSFAADCLNTAINSFAVYLNCQVNQL